MPFSVPNFNIPVNIWRQASGPPASPDVVEDANLAWGKRVSSYQGVISTPNEPVMTLLLPPGADIRGPQCSSGPDWVEAPAGSGRLYSVLGVDDIGKGFANEHRAAIIAWTDVFGSWPEPIT